MSGCIPDVDLLIVDDAGRDRSEILGMVEQTMGDVPFDLVFARDMGPAAARVDARRVEGVRDLMICSLERLRVQVLRHIEHMSGQAP